MYEAYITITIDVEPDCTPTWHYSNPLSFDGVKIGINKILQPIFNKYNMKPSYLINNVVLEDEESIEVFKNLDGEFELGTHLHAEFIRPDKLFDDYAGKKGEMNQCFLEPKIEYEKIKNITELFIKNFGYAPLSFRAGRFSVGVNTIACLENLNYKVDTSVTPNIIWSDETRERPIDFSNVTAQPYFIKKSNLLEKDSNGKLLEVPVSILKYSNLLLKKNIWLRPVYSKFSEMKRLVKLFNKYYSKYGIVVYNMMFHNVEVIPNGSPYTKNEADVNKYLIVLEKFLNYCIMNKIKSVKLSELYEIYQ